MDPSQHMSNSGFDLRHSALSGKISRHSCDQCRRKKVRCDRIQPCSTCLRDRTQCIFQEVKKKRRRYTQPVSPDILARIEKLEERIKSDTSDSHQARHDRAATSAIHTRHEASDTGFATSSIHGNYSDPGRLAVHQEKSRYMSNRVWNVLANDVEEMQDVLDSSTSEDDSEEPLPTDDIFQGFLFGMTSPCNSLHRFYPPADKACYLMKTYEANVAPLVPILHWPTVRDRIMSIVQGECFADEITKTLMFSIYYAATASLSADECHSQLGVGRVVLLSKFRFAVQQAIAEADLLSTQSTMLVQAVVLFLTAVRREDNTRFVWSMTSMIVRIGQYLGLHRDGSQLGLTSFETEIRRRLWWHIVMLDMRSSEEHGTDSQISEGMYNTELPSNVNDASIYPGMTEPVIPQTGFTEMTFCLIRCEVAVVLNKVTSAIQSSSGSQNVQQRREQMVEATSDQIRQKYTNFCDESIPLQKVCVLVSRLVLANLWINVYFRRSDNHLNLREMSIQTRDELFSLSLEVIRASFALESNEQTHRWSWLFHANAHWCYVAFLLSELCVRSPDAFTDEAWGVIDRVQNKWQLTQRHDKKGMLWRPLQRLLQRATSTRSQNMALQEHNGQERPTLSVIFDTLTEPNRYAKSDLPKTQDQIAGSLAASASQEINASSITLNRADVADNNGHIFGGFLPAAGVSELEMMMSEANWAFL
ncbi:hypothetical protein N7476_000114 [Penicillium atrosanguineum]|uniref:Zn(2)-C6 fungal-type domain-containing protein n=1 Tax=Penicillium atrosanguineum TaxID=1132637 RepID=A0A9W9QAZ9_9EURO|nr:hypothetical protein N7476_000114 [Penicillium atrosanguineum]